MKKVFLTIILIFLALLFPGLKYRVSADSENRIENASAYCFDENLYSFFYLDSQYDPTSLTVTVNSNEIKGKTIDFDRIKMTDTSIHYIYLIDKSGSMRKYRDMIETFMSSVEKNEQNNSDITLAFFGEEYEILPDVYKNASDAGIVVSETNYNQAYTDPYMGLEKTIDYIDSKGISEGDLYSIVLITDGEPDFRDKTTDEKQLSEKLASVIEKKSYITISSVCTGEWKGEIYDTISNGIGRHFYATDSSQATKCGEQITNYYDNLCRLYMEIERPSHDPIFDISLTFRGNAEGLIFFKMNLSTVRDMNISELADVTDGKEDDITDNNDDTDEIKNTDDLDQDENKEKIKDEDKDEDKDETISNEDKIDNNIDENNSDEETKEDDQVSIIDNETSDNNESFDDEKSEDEEVKLSEKDEDSNDNKDVESENSIIPDENEDKTSVIIIVVMAGIILILVIILIIVLLKRKKKDDVSGNHGGKLGIIVEMISGKKANKTEKYYIVDSLNIGSDKRADIVISDSSVDGFNSKLTFKEGRLFISDMNSKNGTSIGGMRIHHENVVNSGDVITIGNVSFTIRPDIKR